jgi:hypothetical protein
MKAILLLLVLPLMGGPLHQYRSLRLGMQPGQAVRAVESDIHTNAQMFKAVGPELKAERHRYSGKGETISLLFWDNRLIEIRIDLDLVSPGDADAYLTKLRGEFGPESRAETKKSEEGLELRTFRWESGTTRLTMFRSAHATYLKYEDLAGLAQMTREVNLPRVPPKQELPGL